MDIIGALNDIAEAISGGGSGGGLPDTTEASAGDVLSLDEDKKPTWAAPSGGGEAVILKLNSSFNGLLFEDDTPVNPSNFPYDNVPNVYLKATGDNLFRISRVKTGTTTEVTFVGFAYNQGYTSTVKNFVYDIFQSSSPSTSFSLFTSIVNPALPTIGPNDGGKYLAVKSDRSGLEWVSPPNNDSAE